MNPAMVSAPSNPCATTTYTYYLLRARPGAHGDRPYVGLAAGGAYAVVREALQARRFASRQAAESYAGGMRDIFGEFDIETRVGE